MKFRGILVLAAAGIVAAATPGTSKAGGFSRGTADTDILFEQGRVNARAGVTYVNPTRKLSAHPDAALVGKSYTDSYIMPSVAMQVRPFDPLSCAGTYAQPYGGAASYTERVTPGKLTEKFRVDEFALTCAVRFDLGRGGLHLLGGVFMERFVYDRTNLTPFGEADLTLSGKDYGYRLGVAYDIPEIAFRTQLLYRSATSYGADGTFSILGMTHDALGSGNLPQSLELKVQSGVAPGWLVFGSIKWTDWSVQRTLAVEVPTFPLANSNDIYNWRDGWTVTGGVGHAFNDRVSGSASITWDRGVGTGWDLSSDTWTLALGGSVKDGIGGDVRAGVGLSYLASARETQYVPGFNTAVKSGWAISFGGSYRFNW